MIYRMQQGPCIWQTFRDMYSSRAAANKAIKRLVKLGLVECVGSVSFRGEGGVCYVYVAKGKRVRRNQLKHDVIAMLVIFLLGYAFRCGNDVDPRYAPDFETYAGRKVNWEIDTGATPYGEIKKERIEDTYAECDEPIVWVSCGLWNTSDDSRLEGLKKQAKGKPNMWFVTLEKIQKNGAQAVLVNTDGKEMTVESLATGLELQLPGKTDELSGE